MIPVKVHVELEPVKPGATEKSRTAGPDSQAPEERAEASAGAASKEPAEILDILEAPVEPAAEEPETETAASRGAVEILDILRCV